MGVSTACKMIALVTLVSGSLSLTGAAFAAPCAVPNTIANGQVADASKLMDNFNAVADCAQQGVTATGTPVAGSIPIFSGPNTLASGNLSGDVTTSGGTATTLSNSGVVPNIYTNPILTVDAKGRITAAANGSGGGGGGSGAGFTPPSTTTFTWVNQPSGATINSVAGALQLSAPSLGGSRDLALLMTGAPPPPYERWVRISFGGNNISNFYEAGIALSDASGKVITYGIGTNYGYTVEADYYNSPTDLNSFLLSLMIQPNTLFGVRDDGTNIQFLISYDGVSSFIVQSVSRTAFLSAGPTTIGIFANAYSVPVLMNIAHWGSLPGPM